MPLVYCHTNRHNGKVYVGWCSGTIEKRWGEHCKLARGGSPFLFHRAIRKWGEDAWDHETLAVLGTDAEAKLSEVAWIAKLRAFAYDKGSLGYNQTRGGDGITGHRHSESTRERLRQLNAGENSPAFGKPSANRGRRFSGETREKMRLAHLGKTRTPESRQRQSEAQRGKPHSEERKRNISIAKRLAAAERRLAVRQKNGEVP